MFKTWGGVTMKKKKECPEYHIAIPGRFFSDMLFSSSGSINCIK